MILCEEGIFLGVVGVVGVLGRIGNVGETPCYLDAV